MGRVLQQHIDHCSNTERQFYSERRTQMKYLVLIMGTISICMSRMLFLKLVFERGDRF